MVERLKPRPYVESILTNVVEHIDQINDLIEDSKLVLRRIQPRQPGAILLYLNSHSESKPTCFGCPHLDWRRAWMKGKGEGAKLSLAKIKGNPALKVYRKGEFAQVQHEVRDCIQDVVDYDREKKTYTEILGNLSRMTSKREPTPELKERLTVPERGKVVLMQLLARLDKIDGALAYWSSEIERLQGNRRHLRTELKLERCGRNCDFCDHPRWYIYRQDPEARTGYRRERVDSPLPFLPRNSEDKDDIDEVRYFVKRCRLLMQERQKYQDYIGTLSKMYQARYVIEL